MDDKNIDLIAADGVVDEVWDEGFLVHDYEDAAPVYPLEAVWAVKRPAA